MSFQSLNTEFDSAYEIYTDKLQKPLEVVVCLRCGRPLTNEKSRLARLGPKCARKLLYETRAHSYSAKTLHWYLAKAIASPQRASLPTKRIALYYFPGSSSKPFCKIGSLSLQAIESNMDTNHSYCKQFYVLPLIEGLTYQVFQPLPEPRTFWLQVQDRQLCEKSFFGSSKDPSGQKRRVN